jgi:hypothetical protein
MLRFRSNPASRPRLRTIPDPILATDGMAKPDLHDSEAGQGRTSAWQSGGDTRAGGAADRGARQAHAGGAGDVRARRHERLAVGGRSSRQAGAAAVGCRQVGGFEEQDDGTCRQGKKKVKTILVGPAWV